MKQASSTNHGPTSTADLEPVDPAELQAPSSDQISYGGTNVTATTGCSQCCCNQSTV